MKARLLITGSDYGDAARVRAPKCCGKNNNSSNGKASHNAKQTNSDDDQDDRDETGSTISLSSCCSSSSLLPSSSSVVEVYRLPPGAEHIIKTMACEVILGDMINRFDPSRMTHYHHHRVNFAAVQNLLHEYPELVRGRFYPISIRKRRRRQRRPYFGSLSKSSHDDRNNDYHVDVDNNHNNNNKRELTLLAALCLLNAPLPLVQFVYNLWPEAVAAAETKQGSLPFHYACRSCRNLDVVQFILEKYPPALELKRRDGCLPLHLACRWNASHEGLILFLIQAAPVACSACDARGWFPLHGAASHGNASVTTVQALYQQFPQCLGFGNDQGRTPLHLACQKRGNYGTMVLATLAGLCSRYHPDVLRTRDLFLHTPLCLAVQHQSVHGVDLLMEWTAATPVTGTTTPLTGQGQQIVRESQMRRELMSLRDREGRTLLHLACLRQGSKNVAAATPSHYLVVERLCQLFPAMITARTTNPERQTPLHEICGCKHLLRHSSSNAAALEVIKTLVNHSPSLLLMRDGNGKTAVNLAKRNGASEECLDFLMKRLM